MYFAVSNIDISGALKTNGDPLIPMSYNDLIDKPIFLQGPLGIAADAPGYLPPNALSSTLEKWLSICKQQRTGKRVRAFST